MADTPQIETSARSFFKRHFPFVVHIHNFYTNIKFRDQTPNEVFNSIYRRNAWGNAESLSGEGSEVGQARELIDASGREIRLEIDGGVKTNNIGEIAAAGADTFVAGSAIFGSDNYAATISEMKSEIRAATG